MANKTKKFKTIPTFFSEDEEREFWETHDSMEYIDWNRAVPTTFPNLKPSTKTISIRLPESLINSLKVLAHKQDIGYQSLIKILLSEHVSRELAPPNKRHGTILVLVLVVITLLTLSVLVFTRYMVVEHRGAHRSIRQTQTRLLAESGVEYLRILLMKEPDTIFELGGLYDNEEEFCGHIVTDGSVSMIGRNVGIQGSLMSGIDYQSLGRFSVIAPALSDDGMLFGEEIRFGLEDESTKINLRWVMQTEKQMPGLGKAMLLRLPGVTEEIADSLLDWMDDSSTEPREYGAKDEYYGSLDPPYYCKNGIPDSIDELLLVRGITPKLLYGVDWNRNGVIDLGEPSEASLDEFDVSDGSLNLGLASYLTVDSREANITPDGLPKINVNMDDLEELQAQLEERFPDNPEWGEYIVSYRQNLAGTPGDLAGTPGNLAGTPGNLAGTPGNSASGTKINSLLDLVQTPTTTSVELPGEATQSGAAPTQSQPQSPFSNDISEMLDYLPLLYDNLTLSDEPLVGRININQASRTVLELFLAQDDILTDQTYELTGQLDSASQLAAVVGLGSETSFSSIPIEDIIEGILAERISDPNQIELPEMNYPFWPYTHGIVEDFETMKKLEPYFCTQGSVFKTQVIGRFDEMSPVVRLEVWLDATELGKPARIIRLRELTELGPGYAADMLGVEEY